MVIDDMTGKYRISSVFLHVIHLVSEIYHPSHYPDECLGIRRNGAKVREIILNQFPDACHPENLPAVPTSPGTVLAVPTPSEELKADPQHPPYLMLHCVSVVSPRTQSLLLAAWNRVLSVSPKNHIKLEQSRSKTPAYHWGVWEASASKPLITRESRLQSREAIAAIDNLLSLVGQLVVPKVIRMTRYYLPVQWEAQERYANL
jgi:hypothetical protein